MFGYNPYGNYSSRPYTYVRSAPSYSHTPNEEYLRALADEHTAREQYFAARRAEEDARERALRARLTQQAYAPYTASYLSDNDYDTYEEHDAYDGGFGARYPYAGSGYGYGANQAQLGRQRRAMIEEQRRQEQQRERMRLEEKRKKLQEERRIMEEERMRQLFAEEQRKRREEEERRRRRRVSQLEPFLRNFGWVPDENEDITPRTGRSGFRSQTVAPSSRRQIPSTMQHGQRYPQPHYPYSGAASRSSSVPPNSTVGTKATSPISSKADAAPRQTIPVRTPSPKKKEQATSPTTPSPVAHAKSASPCLSQQTPPRHKTTVDATPEQHAAASKIQEAYRAHTTRTKALCAIDEQRMRFMRLHADFRFPAALEFILPGSGHVSVPAELPALQRTTRQTLQLAATNADAELDIHESTKPLSPDARTRPELAYTTANAPLHAYLEELSRILSALDAVESHGVPEIRERRKALVREVNGEAEIVERCVKAVWAAWVATQAKEQHKREEQERKAEGEVPEKADEGRNVQLEPPARDSGSQVSDLNAMEVESTALEQQPQASVEPDQTQSEQLAILEPPSPPLPSHPEPEVISSGDEGEQMDVEPTPANETAIMLEADEVTVAGIPVAASECAHNVSISEPQITSEGDHYDRESEGTMNIIEAEPEPESDEDRIEIDISEDKDGESMQIEPQPIVENPPTLDVNTEDAPPFANVVQEPLPLGEASIAPEIETGDGYAPGQPKSLLEPASTLGVPVGEVYAAPTSEVEITDEPDHIVEEPPEEAPAATSASTPEPAPEEAQCPVSPSSTHSPSSDVASAPNGPVHLHPSISAYVEPVLQGVPPAKGKGQQDDAQLEFSSAHIERHTPPHPSAFTHAEASASYIVEEPGGDSEKHRPSTPILSPSHADAESEGEAEGPGTPPVMHNINPFGTRSPVIIVTPADEQDMVMSESGEQKRPLGDGVMGMKAGRPPYVLVNRDWKEVEGFDIF